MSECINKECNYNDKKGKCKEPHAFDCQTRKLKTPSYAEEQLEHAKEKESNTPVAAPIDYEEEYHKLKKENEQLKERNILLEEKDQEQEERIKIQKSTIIELKEEIGKILSAGDTKIKELKSIIDSLKLKSAVTEKLEIEINNLNEIIERKDKEIEMWINVSKEADREIAELKRVNSNQEEQIKSLGKSTNEYYHNWIETQKKNEKLIYKNSKLSEKVEVLKEGNIKLLELL